MSQQELILSYRPSMFKIFNSALVHTCADYVLVFDLPLYPVLLQH